MEDLQGSQTFNMAAQSSKIQIHMAYFHSSPGSTWSTQVTKEGTFDSTS